MKDEELTMQEVDLINEGYREKRRVEEMGIATWETESKIDYEMFLDSLNEMYFEEDPFKDFEWLEEVEDVAKS